MELRRALRPICEVVNHDLRGDQHGTFRCRRCGVDHHAIYPWLSLRERYGDYLHWRWSWFCSRFIERCGDCQKVRSRFGRPVGDHARCIEELPF